MILLDANIPMYAAGRDHPHKAPCIRLLEAVARGELEAAVDAEVLQEILHRYRSINRWPDGLRVYRLLLTAVPTVLPITGGTLDMARLLMERHGTLLARDAVYAAVCIESGASALCSYDRDFDGLPEIVRRIPEALLGSFEDSEL